MTTLVFDAPHETRMRREAAEVGAVAARQRRENALAMRDLGALLRRRAPKLVLTCARGSSDHAASFAKYALETRLGVTVASHAPSISSIFGTRLVGLEDALVVVISQSGKSPDLLASMVGAREAGAMVVAMVNDAASPAAELADVTIPLHAGPETAVAATKSYVASLLAISHLVAEWTEDRALDAGLDAAPEALDRAFGLDWSAALDTFAGARSLFTIGRGTSYGVASEAALKLKETSALHAECFSAAEVRHGPMAIVEDGFPLLMFVPDDPTRASFADLSPLLAARGGTVFAVGADLADATTLPSVSGLHPLIAPAAQITSFYGFAETLARLRGRDPDDPPGLAKVTRTR